MADSTTAPKNDKDDSKKAPNKRRDDSPPSEKAPAADISPTEALINIDEFKLPQRFADSLSKPVQPVIQLKRPEKEWFVRVHPEYQAQLGFVELREEGQGRDLFLVHKSIWDQLVDEPTFKRKWLFLARSSHGVLFFWPVNAARSDGRPDSWTDSHLEAIRRAREVWVRVYSDMTARQYLLREAVAQLPEPEWPEQDFTALLTKAVKGRIIDREDHPVLRRLWGLE